MDPLCRYLKDNLCRFDKTAAYAAVLSNLHKLSFVRMIQGQ